MADPLQVYNDNLASADRALNTARTDTSIDERFRALKALQMYIHEARRNLCEWRGKSGSDVCANGDVETQSGE